MRQLGTLLLALGLSVGLGYGQQGVARPAVTPTPVAPAVQPPQSGPVGAPSGPAVATPPVGPNYVLAPEDGIGVTVFKDPTLTGTHVIRPDGKITMPLIGEVMAAGLTPEALGREIASRLKQMILDPIVTVTVTAANSQKIYMVGEVVRQGPVALFPDMTVLQAVSSAGGLTAYANSKHMYVLRGAKGTQQKISFDYKKALKQGNQQGLVLQAGDTIVVP